jgi:hypothetical protein
MRCIVDIAVIVAGLGVVAGIVALIVLYRRGE